jgi:hypothetical protein
VRCSVPRRGRGDPPKCHPRMTFPATRSSTDADPPSRRKVIAAIRETKQRSEVDAELEEARKHAPALRDAISALPDESRTYLVTIRIKSHPDFIERRIPLGFEVVTIKEEVDAA